MIDFSSDIVSGKSIGNIYIGDNISVYTSDLHANHEVKYKEYILPNDGKRIIYSIDNTIQVITLENGYITALSCNVNYKGKYKNIFHSGQTMGDIKNKVSKVRIFNGSLILNEDFGFSYDLDSPYDEIADSIDMIPDDTVLKTIRVADFTSWCPKR